MMSINYVGLPLLLLFLLMVITGWSNRMVRLLGIGFVVIIALALGPNMIVDGQQVVPLPWGKMWGRGNAGMLFQAYTNFYFRIDGGFINASLSRVDALPLPVALLSHPTKDREKQFEAYIRKSGVGAVIVENAWSERWMTIFGRLDMPSRSVGGVRVYDTTSMKKIG